MSVLLRAIPNIALLRSRHLSSLPLLHHHLLKFPISPVVPTTTRSRTISSLSASATSPSSTEAAVPDSKQPPPLPLPDGNTLEWVSRSELCGELSDSDVGKRVRLCGWVALHRIHGSLTFLNLRDHSGIVQVTTLPDDFPQAHSIVKDLRLEYVISVEGTVRLRPSESLNKKMKTGMIEVAAEHVQVLNAVRAKLPFLITTADDATDSAKEDIRLRLMF